MKIINCNPVVLSGRYLVTDPCYIYGDQDWDTFCDLLFGGVGLNNSLPSITVFEIDGKIIPVMPTAYGDGSYPVFDPKTGNRIGGFGVDAGLFALIPWDVDSHDLPRKSLGTVVEFSGVLNCVGGNAFVDGKLIVDTAGSTNEEGYLSCGVS